MNFAQRIYAFQILKRASDHRFCRHEVHLLLTRTWFKYLLKCYNKDLGWIDFEKEIAIVLDVFHKFLAEDSPNFNPFRGLNKSKRDAYILSQFNFFYMKDNENAGWGDYGYIATSDYQIEDPQGSGCFVIYKTKIIKTLHEDLLELSLMCFTATTAMRKK